MEMKNINIRVDQETKADAEKIFNALGLNMTTAITAFLRQTIINNGIPFEMTLNVPNPTTEAAIEEGEKLLKNPNVERFSSAEDLLKALGV